MSRSSFTLIELLVVIAILSVLSVAVVFIINPADIIKQSRDTNRLTDLNNLNKALGVFDVTNPNDFTGTSSIVYVSLPDSTTTCANLSLPALPAGYTYNCVTSSTLTKADGTGWIPVNFTNVSYGSPINRLPIDPVNTSSTGEYYSYIVGGSWELNAILSSSKYRNDDDITKTNLPGVLSIGSDKTLNPVYTTTGLIAYYKFTEQTGTTLNDSASGYTGTITQGSGGWTTDNKGNARAYDFDGANTKIALSPDIYFGTDDFSMTAWINSDQIITNKNILGASAQGLFDFFAEGAYLRVNLYDKNYQNCNVSGWGPLGITQGNWVFLAVSKKSDGNIYQCVNNSCNTKTYTIGCDLGTLSMFIGSRSSNRYFNGSISDIRIYNRSLSAAEIQVVYNSTR